MENFRGALPQQLRFGMSGALGSLAFYVLNEGLVRSELISWQPITVAFFLSYLISIAIQFVLHSSLVFGWHGSIIVGLTTTYAAYAGALFLSAPINAGLVGFFGMTAGQAWLATLLITGAANYFIVGAALGKDKKEEEHRA